MGIVEENPAPLSEGAGIEKKGPAPPSEGAGKASEASLPKWVARTCRPEVPEFSLGGADIPIYMPAIWSLKCTADPHQDNEVSNSIPEITRNSSGGISRRYPGPGENTRGSSEVEVSGTGPPRGTGVFSKLHKVRAIPSSGTRFSGVLDRYSEDGDQPPQREGPTTQEGGSELPTVSIGICEAVSPSHRSVHIHSPSSPPPLPWSSGPETPVGRY